MLVELGPVDSTEVLSWSMFARRVICELRYNPGDLSGIVSEDMFVSWSGLIDEWSHLAANGSTFRWSCSLETEQAEYLLHGFERCVGSDVLRDRATPKELQEHQPFSMQVVRAFVEALSTEGQACQHYVDQVLTAVGDRLNH